MSIVLDKKLILNKLKDYYKFDKDSDFANFLGIKPQTLSSWYTRNTFDIELLYSKCVDINPEFFFTGKGEMSRTSMASEPRSVYKLKTDKLIEQQAIPLYDLEASAGVVTLFRDSKEFTPLDYIQIPNLPKCDGAIYVTGDSMYPLLKSGDIVMYKQMHDMSQGIIWGEMYIVSVDYDGDEIVSVKWIKRSALGDDYIKLVSQNQHHEDRDVPLSRIRALALVKASIRINSMS